MHSTASSVRPTRTAEEEEETDTASYRYVPRTLQQGGPFYSSSVQGKFNDNDRSGNRNEQSKNLGLGKSKSTSEGHPYKSTQSRLHPPFADEFPGLRHSLSASFQYDNASNDRESDNASIQTHSFHSLPAPEPQRRPLTPDDIDIKSIHGEDHYGKLEATPITDNQDKLWTQIDALDDVKKLASNVDLYENFSPGFEEQLTKLRQAHSQLLSMIRDRDALLDRDKNFNRADTENERDYDIRTNKATATSLSHVGDRTDVDGEAKNSNNLGVVDTKRPATSASAGASAGAGADPEASGNANPSASSTRSLRHNKRDKTNTASSMIRIEEDQYVQEMIDIIKQLRA